MGVAKKSKNHFRPIFFPFQAILNNFDFISFLTKQICTSPNFFWGGAKKSKTSFSTNFLAISGNFEQLWFFFIFDKKNVYVPQIFFGGGGLKSSKIIFDQFSRQFRQFWTTLIFFHFWQKNFVPPPIFFFFFGGGGTPKFIFTIFHLVRHNWVYTQNFRPLQPSFLVVSNPSD